MEGMPPEGGGGRFRLELTGRKAAPWRQADALGGRPYSVARAESRKGVKVIAPAPAMSKTSTRISIKSAFILYLQKDEVADQTASYSLTNPLRKKFQRRSDGVGSGRVLPPERVYRTFGYPATLARQGRRTHVETQE